MQKVKNTVVPLSQEELNALTSDEHKYYSECLSYAENTKDVQQWHSNDFDTLVKRDDVFLTFDDMTDRYTFIAYSPFEIMQAYDKFTDADDIRFFQENVEIDDADELDITMVKGFTININEYASEDACVTLTPIVHELVPLKYIGSLVFPCIVSIWMSGEGYGRICKEDGTVVLALKDLSVSKFADLDK